MINQVFKKYVEPVFALVLVQVPVWFVWHTELVFSYTGKNLTNGFLSFNGMTVYHVGMYSMFMATFIAALYIIVNYSKSSTSEITVFR